ncbi:MAG: hypothetical protein FWE05_01185 [Defluviitaleaceae bacterium]|nr:hypothetical protein [Defluviitaleaceae bacterium]
MKKCIFVMLLTVTLALGMTSIASAAYQDPGDPIGHRAELTPYQIQ